MPLPPPLPSLNRFAEGGCNFYSIFAMSLAERLKNCKPDGQSKQAKKNIYIDKPKRGALAKEK